MDAPRGLNPTDADEALRDLFRDAGTVQAREGFEDAVMARLSRGTAPATERPLLPRWTWALAAALCAGLLLMPAKGLDAPAWMTGWTTAFGKALSPFSDWTVLGLACGTALLALHLWLERRLAATHP